MLAWSMAWSMAWAMGSPEVYVDSWSVAVKLDSPQLSLLLLDINMTVFSGRKFMTEYYIFTMLNQPQKLIPTPGYYNTSVRK